LLTVFSTEFGTFLLKSVLMRVTDQVTKWKARGYSLDTSADIQRRMAHEFNGDFECCGPPVPVPNVADAFDQLEAHVFLFCNKAAKALWAYDCKSAK
jgi:hypothetical protein